MCEEGAPTRSLTERAPGEREAGDAGEPERAEVEDDELDAAPELLDQPEERGDDALGERAVDAARDDEGDSHRPPRRTIARP